MFVQPVAASGAFASMQSTQLPPAGPPSFKMHSHRAKPSRHHSKSANSDDEKMTAAEAARNKKRSAKNFLKNPRKAKSKESQKTFKFRFFL